MVEANVPRVRMVTAPGLCQTRRPASRGRRLAPSISIRRADRGAATPESGKSRAAGVMRLMPALAQIVIASTAMALIALTGSITLILPGPVFNRVVLPLVALAAGSLLGGALFHLLPEAVTLLGNDLGVYG